MKIVDEYGPVFSDQLTTLNVKGLYVAVCNGSVPCGPLRETGSDSSEVMPLREHWGLKTDECQRILAEGDSMLPAGIHDGDILVIDKSLAVQNRSTVVAIYDGEFTTKYFYLNPRTNQVWLVPANKNYPPIVIEDPERLQIVGVVATTIHTPPRASMKEIEDRMDDLKRIEQLEQLRVRTIDAGYMSLVGLWKETASNEFKAVWVEEVCAKLGVEDKWSWASENADVGNLKQCLYRLKGSERYEEILREVRKIVA